MAADVIAFPELTPEQALARMRELSHHSGLVLVMTQPRRQMAQRRASRPQIMQVLRYGVAVHGPCMDLLGDWTCWLEERAVGRNVDLEVMMIRVPGRLIIKTVFV